MLPRQRLSPRLPAVWLISDERVDIGCLLRAARRLPRGSGIILRHYRTATEERRALFDALRRIAWMRGHVLLLAGSMEMARDWGADGVHLSGGQRLRRSAPRSGVVTAPVHTLRELRLAERNRADLVFLSPLFATRSHPGARPLGSCRFAAIARQAGVPVMALGGVKPQHRLLLRRVGASGYGAIDSLAG
jgi:thiamine-phosphate pyrophosphorylase